MKKYILLAITLSILHLNGIAQETDSVKKTTLTLASIFSTNANYYGQVAEERLPYTLLNATLRTPYYFYITGGGYRLLNNDFASSAYQLGAGFEFELGKTVELDIGYTRSFYPEGSPLLQASNSNNASATISADHVFKTSATVDYAFGNEDDYFITLGNSKQIRLGQITSKDQVIIQPGIEVVAGTQRYYEAYISEQKRQGKLLDFLPGKPPQTVTDTVITQSNSIKMLSYSFQLPVYYYRSQYAISATYQLSILDPGIEAVSNKPKSFFSLGFFYQF